MHPLIIAFLVIFVIGIIIGAILDIKKKSKIYSTPAKSYTSFNTKVVGVTAKNINGVPIQSILKTLSSDSIILLIREPTNKFDKNAIMVFADSQHIGYLSADIAVQYASLIDSKAIQLTCRLNQITGGDNGKNYGCNINVRVAWF